MFRDAQVLPGQALRGYTAAPPQQAYRPAGLLTWDLIQLRLRDGVGLPIPQHDPNAGFEWLEHAAPDFTFADIPYADKLIQLSGKCALTVQQGSLSCLRPGSCQDLAEARCAGDGELRPVLRGFLVLLCLSGVLDWLRKGNNLAVLHRWLEDMVFTWA